MQKAELAQLPPEIAEEISMLRGLRDLVGERTGYFFGAKMLGKTMNEKTETERKAVTATSKELREAIGTLIETPTKKNAEAVTSLQTKNEKAREVNKKARAPHMAKINPLRKAVRYIDTVALPDSLKELGTPVQPRFSLSEWVQKAIEQKKQKEKNN